MVSCTKYKRRVVVTCKKVFFNQIIGCLLFFLFAGNALAETVNSFTSFDLRTRQMGFECRDEVKSEFIKFLNSNRLTLAQLFDTFYVPIPNTQPQKFHTSYDKVTDEMLRLILDKFLDFDKRILFVVAVDRNGYVPTHNSKYSKPLTNDPDYNSKHNRTKQLYNDRTGLAAAKNKKQFLLQTYSRDTGEEIYDLSIPILIKDRHWGAVRIGYTQ